MRALAPLAACLLALVMAQAAVAGEVRGFAPEKGRYASDSLIVSSDEGRSVATVAEGETPIETAKRLAKRPGVKYVKPNYIGRIADDWTPNDRGKHKTAGKWQQLQWNFVGTWGVDVLPAWRKLRDLGRAGGSGAVVAIIDTGVAYENRGRYRRSPDLLGVKIKSPHDFLGHDKFPDDSNGHGTHVASTVFERTDNEIGVTGLAYGATLMPIRALNSKGFGNEVTVARAIRYAADRGADIINLSVEFNVNLSASDLPTIVSAMRYARLKGALVVAAAGNQESNQVAYPARSGYALAVGATTASGCLADYSNYGRGIDLVAPGGGADTFDTDNRPGSTDRTNCKVTNPALPIYQMTFFHRDLRRFYLPSIYQGTSMAAPHVSGTAALTIASEVIGKNPRPVDLQKRLQATATDLGSAGYDTHYGHGLVNAARAVGAE